MTTRISFAARSPAPPSLPEASVSIRLVESFRFLLGLRLLVFLTYLKENSKFQNYPIVAKCQKTLFMIKGKEVIGFSFSSWAPSLMAIFSGGIFLQGRLPKGAA